MIFSDTTYANDALLQDCEMTLFGDDSRGTITSDTNRLAIFTQLINRALDKVTSLILECDGRWEFDDTNYTDLPIGTTTLVNNQQDYSLSVSHLRILRIEILGADGKYVKIDPIDFGDVDQQAMTEFMNGAGTTKYYDLLGGSVFLYPKPQTGYVTMAQGLKIYYQRVPSYFVTTDTTKVPGFVTLFHRLISRWACWDYAIMRNLSNKNDLKDQVLLLESQLKDFYSARDDDDDVSFRVKDVNWN
jgi:hypothetical protein